MEKQTIGKERTVAACKESLPTSRGPHRNRFLEVQADRNLISVGGCADTPVDLVAAGNADGNRPFLGNGKTVLMRTPTQAECWSEAIIRNGLPPALVDDPLFRKALVTTSRMGQTAVCMGAREQLLERGTLLCHIAIHSLGKSFRRQTRGWMKRTWRRAWCFHPRNAQAS